MLIFYYISTGNKFLQETNPLLIRSLNVRNPYVDPLNVIQAELLHRLRTAEKDGSRLVDGKRVPVSEEEKRMLKDALLVTINGIANGMRNSG